MSAKSRPWLEKAAEPAPKKKESSTKPKAKVTTAVVTTAQAQLPQTGNSNSEMM